MNTNRTTARRVSQRTHAPRPQIAPVVAAKDVKVIRITAKDTKVVYK